MTHKFQYSKKFKDGGILVVGGDNIKEFEKNYTSIKSSDLVKHLISEPTTPQPSPVGITPPEADPSWCPIHNVTMEKRSNDKGSWFSHKAGEEWCKGK
jgi:hypothetical protein